MNFTLSEFSLGRQRCRQWVSLITQQLRLRHIYQIFAYNLQSDKKGSFFFTLHLTSMSSPFYTSERIDNRSPKWAELSIQDIPTSASSVVIRIWKQTKSRDEIMVTWGVNFSGLVYLGNKIADLPPRYFNSNTVIFFMQGGYFTSQNYIKMDLSKAPSIEKHANLIETLSDRAVYRKVALKTPKNEVQSSYTLEKLRRLQELQRQIKNINIDVHNVKEQIKSITLSNEQKSKSVSYESAASNCASNVRFAPQLLTMNSLNKMLHEKPTKSQREEMGQMSKKIEVGRFRLRMLSQEKARKSVGLRMLRLKKSKMVEENQEHESTLMSNYHLLNRATDRLKEYKRSLIHHKELHTHINAQLHHRQKQLLKELLFIYPIEKLSDEKYTMMRIALPNSDVLTESSDIGLSVVLGYVTHALVMCSIFLQVPLRYPLKHFGSRSVITDQVSRQLSDKDREFPLYTKGKEKAHFGYAVYLLNKNLAQLRWLFYMDTRELKATLPNLLSFLQGTREFRPDTPTLSSISYDDSLNVSRHINDSGVSLDKWVSLSTIGSSSCQLSDPILDSIRQESRLERAISPAKKTISSPNLKKCKNDSCRNGSSEVLAVPEAFLNKQISRDLFTRCASGQYRFKEKCDIGCNNYVEQKLNSIKVRDGVEECSFRNNISSKSDSIEEGTDPLDTSTNLSSIITKSIKIKSDQCLTQKSEQHCKNKGISRSVGSYTDDEMSSLFRPSFELGSDPIISVARSKERDRDIRLVGDTGVQVGQQQFLEHWILGTKGENSVDSSNEVLFQGESLRVSLQDLSSPLTARTDRLLSTNKSFNLVKHRPMD